MIATAHSQSEPGLDMLRSGARSLVVGGVAEFGLFNFVGHPVPNGTEGHGDDPPDLALLCQERHLRRSLIFRPHGTSRLFRHKRSSSHAS